MTKYVVVLILLISSIQVRAEPVNELMDLLVSKESAAQIRDQVAGLMSKSDPNFASYEEIFRQWSEKYPIWDEIKSEMSLIYKRHFTDDEIVEMVKYFKSPVGKKSMKLMPIIFKEGSQAGVRVSKRYRAELKKMLESAEL